MELRLTAGFLLVNLHEMIGVGMNKIIELLKLTRIEHSMMLVIAVLAAERIAFGIPSMYILVLSLLTPILISMGSFAINDYFDIKVDRLNKKMGRPLVSGALKPKTALYTAALAFSLGIIASAMINLYAFAIALVFAALAFLYSYKLKEILLVGNIYIALAMVIPFIYGSYVVSNVLPYAIIVISIMVFLSGLAREIHGTIRDYRGDIKERESVNLPKLVGTRGSSYLALILYLIAISLSVYLFLYVAPFSYNLVFLSMMAASDILVLYSGIGYVLVKSKKSGFYDLSRNISLLAMAIALLAILISSFANI